MNDLNRLTEAERLRGLGTLLIFVAFFGNLMFPDKHHAHRYWLWLSLAGAALSGLSYILHRSPKIQR